MPWTTCTTLSAPWLVDLSTLVPIALMAREAIRCLSTRSQHQTERTPGFSDECQPMRRSLIEHPFGTIKDCMGRAHFQTRSLPNVRTEMRLHILAYNLKRAVAVLSALPHCWQRCEDERRSAFATA